MWVMDQIGFVVVEKYIQRRNINNYLKNLDFEYKKTVQGEAVDGETMFSHSVCS